jgi:predicted pyridoxine 5'-phosphate oxidase superfamily flavin-nucleotide-binding protein
MRNKYLHTLTTPSVEKAQVENYGRARPVFVHDAEQSLGPEETQFIAERDSFYLGSVSENGWPYVQHRGGPKGFLRVIGDAQLAFGDYNGNRQLLTTGNVGKSDRVSLFLMNYPARERLKIIGHAHVLGLEEGKEIARDLIVPAGARIERVFVVDVVGFDWNCPKYITPRFTREEVAQAVAPLHARIAELEAELKRLGR